MGTGIFKSVNVRGPNGRVIRGSDGKPLSEVVEMTAEEVDADREEKEAAASLNANNPVRALFDRFTKDEQNALMMYLVGAGVVTPERANEILGKSLPG